MLKFEYYKVIRRLGFKIPKHIVLQYARYIFINKYKYRGMCYSITESCRYFKINDFIEVIFNKFTYKFCGGKNILPNSYTYDHYWWHFRNVNDRLKAFDKLIEYYKEHKEYI